MNPMRRTKLHSPAMEAYTHSYGAFPSGVVFRVRISEASLTRCPLCLTFPKVAASGGAGEIIRSTAAHANGAW